MAPQPKQGRASAVLTWERLGETHWTAAGTRAEVRWSNDRRAYIAFHPETGDVLRNENDAHKRFRQVRVFVRPEDGKAAVRRIVLAIRAEVNRDVPMMREAAE